MRTRLELRINPADQKEYLTVRIPDGLVMPKTKTALIKPGKYEVTPDLGDPIVASGRRFQLEDRYWISGEHVKELGLGDPRIKQASFVISGEQEPSGGAITLRLQAPDVEHGGRRRVYIPVWQRQQVEYDPSKPVYLFPITGYSEKYEPPEYGKMDYLEVSHLNTMYPHRIEHSDIKKIGKDWYWFIPEEIYYKVPGESATPLRPYDMFADTIRRNYPVESQMLSTGEQGLVYVDIGLFPSGRGELAKEIAIKNRIAFRTMSNNNYALKKEGDYPFFAEVRTSWLTAYPRIFFIPDKLKNETPDVLSPMLFKRAEHLNNLTLTTFNMVHWVFIHKREDGGYGRPLRSRQLLLFHDERTPKFNYNWDKNAPVDMVAFGTRYGTRPGKSTTGASPPSIVISEGQEINHPVDYATFRNFSFEKAQKYCRMVNKQNMYYEYSDDYINTMVRNNIYVYVDKDGLIWLTPEGLIERG